MIDKIDITMERYIINKYIIVLTDERVDNKYYSYVSTYSYNNNEIKMIKPKDDKTKKDKQRNSNIFRKLMLHKRFPLV